MWTAGLEYDGQVDNFKFGLTAIGEFGDITVNPAVYNNHDKVDFKGYLFDLRGSADFGPVNVHAKGIYASGDGKNDYAKTGDDYAFVVPGYQLNVGGYTSYYDQSSWAEIMGGGMFDYQLVTSGNSNNLGTQVTNAIIGGIGGAYKLLPDLKFSADLWYA